MITASPAGRWFVRLIWVGIVANFTVALPTVVAPDRMLALLGLPAAAPALWPQFAALLTVLLTGAYVPAALDPDRYRANVWLAITVRFCGVMCFAFIPEYRLLAWYDGLLFIPQALLLAGAIHVEQRTQAFARTPVNV